MALTPLSTLVRSCRYAVRRDVGNTQLKGGVVRPGASMHRAGASPGVAQENCVRATPASDDKVRGWGHRWARLGWSVAWRRRSCFSARKVRLPSTRNPRACRGSTPKLSCTCLCAGLSVDSVAVSALAAGESVLAFGFAAAALEYAFQQSLLRPFGTAGDR